MTELPELSYNCPYCGEPLVYLVDPSLDAYHTIEDCFVCCRPIELYIERHDAKWRLSAHTDSD